MGINLINNADLSFQEIGFLIDGLSSKIDTCYYGKISYYEVELNKKMIKIQIRYLKKYTEWRFDTF